MEAEVQDSSGKRNSKIFSIPNLLSSFRIVLAVIIPIIYYGDIVSQKMIWLVVVILISALTDFLDGKIARKYNMVSELGKILDPIADKLTQAVLLICMLTKSVIVRYIFLVFVIKEVIQGLTGLIVIKTSGENHGAKWYGKVSTAVFYVAVVILFFIPNLPGIVVNGLLLISTFLMLFAFGMYMREFVHIMNRCNKK